MCRPELEYDAENGWKRKLRAIDKRTHKALCCISVLTTVLVGIYWII